MIPNQRRGIEKFGIEKFKIWLVGLKVSLNVKMAEEPRSWRHRMTS